jgi:hypothetical protein
MYLIYSSQARGIFVWRIAKRQLDVYPILMSDAVCKLRQDRIKF